MEEDKRSTVARRKVYIAIVKFLLIVTQQRLLAPRASYRWKTTRIFHALTWAAGGDAERSPRRSFLPVIWEFTVAPVSFLPSFDISRRGRGIY